MGYKYDSKNGYRNADQLNADIDEFNQGVVKAVASATDCERKEKNADDATRSFINKTALNIEEEKENIKKEKVENKVEKKEIPSYYIAASIKEDIKNQEMKKQEMEEIEI